jgi:hypothetical protein
MNYFTYEDRPISKRKVIPFIKWIWLHRSLIFQQLYNHFGQENANHTFRLRMHYNNGFSDGYTMRRDTVNELKGDQL